MSPPTQIPAGKTPAQPSRTAQPTKHPIPLKLEIVEPAPKARLEIDPGTHTTEPAMPKLHLLANVTVNGTPAAIGTVRWEFHLSGQYRVRDFSSGGGYRQQTYNFAAGNTETKPGERKEFQLAPALITGGTLEVKASYTGGPEVGGATVTKTVAGCSVIGKVVPRAEITAYIIDTGGDLTWLFLRMFYVESRFRQFTGGGAPLFGDPAGVGVAQRDAEPPEWVFPADAITNTNNFFPRIFWNWKRNIDEGMAYFRSEKVRLGRHDLAQLQKRHPTLPAPTEDLVMRAAIRRNNGGIEYQASPDGLHYLAPARSGRDYANEVITAPVPEADPYPVPDDTAARVWPAIEDPVGPPAPPQR